MVIVYVKFDRNRTTPAELFNIFFKFLLELRLAVTLTFDPLAIWLFISGVGGSSKLYCVQYVIRHQTTLGRTVRSFATLLVTMFK